MNNLDFSRIFQIRAIGFVPFALALALSVTAPIAAAAQSSTITMWAAEWVREGSEARALGFLRLRDGKLSFSLQDRREGWELELTDVKRVAVNDGRTLTIQTVAGEEYVLAAMQPNLMPTSPKKLAKALEEALKDATGRRSSR